MKEVATVSRVDGKLVAEVVRPEACKKCRGCELSREERFFLPIAEDGGYREGDSVTLTLPGGHFGAAALLAYGVPFVMFLLGLFIGGVLFHDEIPQAILAIIMLGVGFVILKLIDRPLREKKTFAPTVRPCIQIEGRIDGEEE